MDNVFKAVFTKNTPESQGALAKLLSAIIGRELSVITLAANEPAVDNIRERQIRFDISCRTASGEPLNVEMSLNPDKFEPVRLEYHAGKLFTAQDIRGADKTFDDLKPAYQIAFLVRGRFFADEGFFHSFEYYDPERSVPLNGRSRIITLELAKLDKVIEKPAGEMSGQEHWAVFFRYLTDKGKRRKINEIMEYEEGIKMASEVLLTISRDEIERARLLSEYKYVVDTQSKVVQARREGYSQAKTEAVEHIRQAQEQIRQRDEQIRELQRQLGQTV
jgi:predicted transposase/invertase (TIGR01784 family)